MFQKALFKVAREPREDFSRDVYVQFVQDRAHAICRGKRAMLLLPDSVMTLGLDLARAVKLGVLHRALRQNCFRQEVAPTVRISLEAAPMLCEQRVPKIE